MWSYVGWGIVNIVSTVLYCFVGFGLLGIGYKVFEFITPYDFDRQITEDKNIPLGIIAGCVIVSVALIVIFVILKYAGRVYH